MYQLRRVFPAIAKDVAQSKERGHPDGGAWIGKGSKAPKTELRHAGDDRGEMPHAWNEVAYAQHPETKAVEHAGYVRYMLGRDAHILAIAVDHVAAELEAQKVTERDTAHTAGQTEGEGRNSHEAALVNQVAAEDQQGLIGDWQAQNAQHQEEEQAGIAVLRKPRQERLHSNSSRRITGLRYDSDMAQSNSLTFEVKCPCCEATLQIDPELQIVLHHQAVEKKPPIEDLQAAVQNLKGEAARRNDIFEKSFASHLTADKVREKKFDELLKQAKEDKTGARPKRPFDLD